MESSGVVEPAVGKFVGVGVKVWVVPRKAGVGAGVVMLVVGVLGMVMRRKLYILARPRVSAALSISGAWKAVRVVMGEASVAAV